MTLEVLFVVLSSWELAAVCIVVMLLLPIAYYMASLRRKPVKIKRVPQRVRKPRDELQEEKPEVEADEADSH